MQEPGGSSFPKNQNNNENDSEETNAEFNQLDFFYRHYQLLPPLTNDAKAAEAT